MDISLSGSRISSFRQWSKARPRSSNDDDNPGGATPLALVESPSAVREGRAHRPWAVPGVGGSL
jgi:hypothetical protein